MGLRGARRRQAVDRGFVLSDHADWLQLNTAIEACACERVIATHGYTAVFARWLRSKGLQAEEATTEYGEELNEVNEQQINAQEETTP
jgi:putative mRNA 3-end processing factor